MIRAGGDPPGFGPFIRPEARIGEEHATWGDGRFRAGEAVFLELSGCVGRYHAPLGRLVRIGDVGRRRRDGGDRGAGLRRRGGGAAPRRAGARRLRRLAGGGRRRRARRTTGGTIAATWSASACRSATPTSSPPSTG